MGKKLYRQWPYILLVFFAFLFLSPFLIMLIGSFVKMRTVVGNPYLWLFQENLTLDNYRYIFTNGRFIQWIANSLIITIIPVLSQMFFAAILGYIFAKKRFFAREFIFWVMMAVIMVPNQLLIIPRYIVFKNLEWINTYWPLIVPELWGILGVFFVRQFMMTLPKELEEAAYMDGANDFTVFFKILLPLSKPVIATVGTFAFIGCWNDLLTPLIYTTSEEMYPLTVGLASMLTKEGNFGVEMAGSVISFIPTFLIFLFFQKYFVKGIALSGLK
ncbi:MAG: carbohydrate ABC transporter permease [Caldibacillus debilis]|jgi:multiple sugar transport system permease protein|uniref:Carbohydrate ABC transporter permease n=1 Tax=Caldibacillus debilis TaxID=301148 RepID=A0A3E0K463_9BACI|nr:carbohydrate ABC transporter permease [Caldibacillus debilis]MBO2482873.1 carbohydrate ABC transporter permease [Bacillaceae bacterium]OUM93277.1 MAG: sugar ABC transporter permease [Caldibacillus debilis]REJ27686.1 MAG: carbohydrate ABC transporter permease [Caldibacillus debilis]REJ28372.1 MAG: carbohydrate ABC transporter permease [Caldibacillus debilis]